MATALWYCDINSNNCESLLQGQAVCGGADSSWSQAAAEYQSFYEICQQSERAVAGIDQISDVGPINDGEHLEPLLFQ